MTTAYIGLGTNLGDRMANLARAVEAVAHLPQTHVEAVSNAYETVPAYVEGQPPFLNAVAKVSTGLQADALLGLLLDIERDMGRATGEDKGPRIIDLDLLTFGDEEWNTPELTLPHPGLAERDFVVTPLLEIEPGFTLPDGTRLERSKATLGTVLGDEGAIPNIGAIHDVPVEPVEWVPVAQSESTADRIVGFDASLQLKHEVLAQEGIPVAWDPHEPGVDLEPFGLPVVYRLLVPVTHAEQARVLLGALEAAEPESPDEPIAL